MRVYKFYSLDRKEVIKFFISKDEDSVIIQFKNEGERSLIRSLTRKEAYKFYKQVRKVFFTEAQWSAHHKARKEILDFLFR